MTTYVLDDLEDFLTTYNAGALGLTFGTNFFAGIMPQTPDNAVSIYEYVGDAPEYVMGAANPLPAISKPRIQVLVRNTDYQTARSQCEAVVRALETICNQDVNGTFYQRVERLQDPFLLHRDAALRVFVACNVAAGRTPT